jgi:hypothetical protein
MCVTMGPARLSRTALYVGEVSADDSKPIHAVGYQNKVQNLPGPDGPTGNAMILPFPAVPGTMSQANVIPTEDCPHILDDMVTTVREYDAALHRIATWGFRSLVGLPHEPKVEVFESGIYTVILAQDACAIAPALERVSEAKRPLLKPSLFDAYARWYPDWAIALCCFNNNEAAQATPMLWWYEPACPEELFAPTLDWHTGAVPDLGASVRLDHTLAVGSERMEQEDGMDCWQEAIDQIPETKYQARAREAIEKDPYYKQITRVHYRDAMGPSVTRYLTGRVVGGIYDGYMPNGDFVCRTADVRKKRFLPRRTKPPGA